MPTTVVVVAHDVGLPLSAHRSREFAQRIRFFAESFEDVVVISRDHHVARKTPEAEDNIRLVHVGFDLLSSSLSVLEVVSKIKGRQVLFADGVEHSLSCVLASQMLRVPLCTYVQGYESELMILGFARAIGLDADRISGLGLVRLLSALETLAYRQSSKVICVSKPLVHHVQGLIPRMHWGDVCFIPHSLQYTSNTSVDAERWATGVYSQTKGDSEEAPRIIMTVGAGRMKGTDIAIRALQVLVQKLKEVRLIVVGKDIDPRYLSLAQRLGVLDRTLFFERLDRDKVVALLRRSSAFLLPTFSEGNSIAITEAMAVGVPVVVKTHSSIAEALGENALISITSSDALDFAQAVMRVIVDTRLRESLTANARNYVAPHLLISESARLALFRSAIVACSALGSVTSYR